VNAVPLIVHVPWPYATPGTGAAMIENGRWPPLGADSVSCSPDLDHEVVVAQLGVRPDVADQRAGRIDTHALVGREAVLADGAGAHLHDPVHAARHATLPDELAVAGFGEPAVFRFDPDLIEALIVLGEREEAGARTD
jgi:hypothetical protein